MLHHELKINNNTNFKKKFSSVSKHETISFVKFKIKKKRDNM